jgi:hypothetical protein
MLKELAHQGPNVLLDRRGFCTTEKGRRLANFFVQLRIIISIIQFSADAIPLHLQE